MDSAEFQHQGMRNARHAKRCCMQASLEGKPWYGATARKRTPVKGSTWFHRYSGLQGDQAASLLLAEARDVGIADIARAARLVLDLVGGTVSLVGTATLPSASQA